MTRRPSHFSFGLPRSPATGGRLTTALSDLPTQRRRVRPAACARRRRKKSAPKHTQRAVAARFSPRTVRDRKLDRISSEHLTSCCGVADNTGRGDGEFLSGPRSPPALRISPAGGRSGRCQGRCPRSTSQLESTARSLLSDQRARRHQLTFSRCATPRPTACLDAALWPVDAALLADAHGLLAGRGRRHGTRKDRRRRDRRGRAAIDAATAPSTAGYLHLEVPTTSLQFDGLARQLLVSSDTLMATRRPTHCLARSQRAC